MSNTKHKPYFEVGEINSPIDDALKVVSDALSGVDGFKIEGTHKGYKGAYVLGVSSEKLLALLSELTHELRGLMSVLRVALYPTEEGKTVLTFQNPIYWGGAMYHKEIDQALPVLEELNKQLADVLGPLVDTSKMEEYGHTKGMTTKQLQKYHYMMGMPYLNDTNTVGKFDSFAHGLHSLKSNLARSGREDGGTSLSWSVVDEEKEWACFGVRVGGKHGEEHAVPIIDIGDTKHVSAFPYEILLIKNKAVALHGRFRIALAFPELKMTTFSKIMLVPGHFEKECKEVSKCVSLSDRSMLPVTKPAHKSLHIETTETKQGQLDETKMSKRPSVVDSLPDVDDTPDPSYSQKESVMQVEEELAEVEATLKKEGGKKNKKKKNKKKKKKNGNKGNQDAEPSSTKQEESAITKEETFLEHVEEGPTADDTAPATLSQTEATKQQNKQIEEVLMEINADGDINKLNFCTTSGGRVLCLDGGGMRGVIQVAMLEMLEEKTGKKVTEMFDLIVGTSIGGLIAICIGVLNMGLCEAREMLETMILEDVVHDPKGRLSKLAGSTTKFKAQKMEKLLKKQFSAKSLENEHYEMIDSVKVAILCALSEEGDEGIVPFVFRNYHSTLDNILGGHVLSPGQQTGRLKRSPSEALFRDDDWWFIARATMAAPSYFKPVVSERGRTMIDGSVITNCPTTIAMNEYFALFPDVPLQLCLSMGTGRPWVPPAGVEDKLAKVMWKNLQESDNEFEKTKRYYEEKHPDCEAFVRLNVDLNSEVNAAIDETDAERLKALSEYTIKFLTDTGSSAPPQVDGVCKIVCEYSPIYQPDDEAWDRESTEDTKRRTKTSPPIVADGTSVDEDKSREVDTKRDHELETEKEEKEVEEDAETKSQEKQGDDDEEGDEEEGESEAEEEKEEEKEEEGEEEEGEEEGEEGEQELDGDVETPNKSKQTDSNKTAAIAVGAAVAVGAGVGVVAATSTSTSGSDGQATTKSGAEKQDTEQKASTEATDARDMKADAAEDNTSANNQNKESSAETKDEKPVEKLPAFGTVAPKWCLLDHCMLCDMRFTFFKRRHHCRACGRSACGNCSPHSTYIPHLRAIARVCNDCHTTSRKSRK